MDHQHRPGGKAGTFGVASASQEAVDRRERLRKLALELSDVTKDPYIVRNYVGQYECKLCLTVHPNEGNYLAHTQGKRHQENLGKRAAKEAHDRGVTAPLPLPLTTGSGSGGRRMTIGRPGYRVLRAVDGAALVLRFEIDFKEIEEGLQPRHRFMSAYEQRVEAPDKEVQYLLFAGAPYETIGFAISSAAIDREAGKFFTHWDARSKTFTLQMQYKPGAGAAEAR